MGTIDIKLKKQLLLTFLFLTIVLTAIPIAFAQGNLSKPTINLPNNWIIDDETNYPNAASEYDSQGAGMVTYMDQDDHDFVMIFYENAPAATFNDSQLQNEAERIFNRDISGVSISDSGVDTFAGVKGGWAKGYESSYDIYDLEVVFVKGNVYFDVYACYDANSQDEQQVMSLINSINAESPFPWLIVIIAVVAVVIVIVIAVVVVRSRRRKQKNQVQEAPPRLLP